MKRLLIANRGEIACRIISSARRHGLTTIAVYSEADADSLHVAEADEALPLGPAPARESYLVLEKLMDAVRASHADAVHPGYGFLSENAGFASAVEAAGLVWVGPTPESIQSMGNKDVARELARAAGVPVAGGSRPVTPEDQTALQEAAAEVGFPLLVKAAAGGGGIGMRLVKDPGSLSDVVTATASMAGNAFGDATVFLERYIENARHVEVQIFGDGKGGAIHLGERDCSVQRRFQKVIEEAPAPGLPDRVRTRMCDAAVALAMQQRYRGAGTVEFIVDADSFDFYFLEMNTRIQVEHPVTELITNTDLVGMQLTLARGEFLPMETPVPSGHAIECRLYAENPKKHFFPSPGRLEVLQFPTGLTGTRIDTGYRQGDEVTVHYDPLIAKLVTHGRNREEALKRMANLLGNVEVHGIASNLEFLRRTVVHEAFEAGGVSTSFIDTHGKALVRDL
ncbi:MAG: biotin carboxylase N-terminal domain-containing protein [Pseudomonadota bacterium]